MREVTSLFLENIVNNFMSIHLATKMKWTNFLKDANYPAYPRKNKHNY